MSLRFFVYTLFGLVVGLAAGAGVQMGFNVLRYLVQPDWLAGGAGEWIVAGLGLLVALLVAGCMSFPIKRTLKGAPVRWAMLGITLGVVLDPYFLAEFGWTGPAQAQWLTRAAALTIAAAGLAPALSHVSAPVRLYNASSAAAVLLYTALPRFALVPALGGQLDLAAMSPIYLLVYAKGLVLLLLAAALTLYLSQQRADPA